MTLRSYLVGLTLAALLPVAIFAALVGTFLVSEQRETFRAGAEARTLAVLTAVDHELNGSISILSVLATLPSLDEGDLDTFRRQAQRTLATLPQWANINLALPDGQQLMNLQVPPGAPLPNIGALDGSFERLRATGEPVVSDLAYGPVLKRWSFAVRVPVMRKGQIRYVLSAGVQADSITKVIRAQGLPADWVGVVVDRNGRIVARNIAAETSEGQFASQSLRQALARAPSGWFRGSTIEGVPVYTPYRRSELSGWAYAMGIPAATVDAVLWRGVAYLALGLSGAIAIAFILAHLVSRRIASPIASLASAAGTMARGVPLEMRGAPRIEEVSTLARAMQESSHAIAERQELVEREKKALEAADRAKDEFLAMLSHELRNPLAALSAAAHVLKTGKASSDGALKAGAVIERQTRHMARLVSDLLDIGSVSAGKIRLERELLDVAEVVGRVARTAHGSSRSPPISSTTPSSSARRARRSRSAFRAKAPIRSCGSPTRAWAFSRAKARASSACSSRASIAPAGWAWALRSSSAWSRCTAAACRSRAKARDAGPSLPCGCRPWSGARRRARAARRFAPVLYRCFSSRTTMTCARCSRSRSAPPAMKCGPHAMAQAASPWRARLHPTSR